jgi:enoyl-CoA hydratase/carnithine racemase
VDRVDVADAAGDGLDAARRASFAADLESLMKPYNTLDWKVDADGILTLTLNRPQQLNSFTIEMCHELIDAFNTASDDDSVRAIVVTGSGRAFCAGMDLSVGGNVFGLDETQEPTLGDLHTRIDDPEILDGVRDTGGRVTLAIYDCKKPVIAAINGPAVGIGATMTLAMDIRLASDKARIGFVFGKIGIVPEACSTWFLPRLVGMQQALEWVYSADIIDAAEAQRGGLVRSVHAPEALLEAAYELARKFTRNRSPVAVALARQMMWRNSAQPHPIEAHRIDTLAVFYTSAADGKEGVRSFLEKRDPDYRSKASDMPPFYPWWG